MEMIKKHYSIIAGVLWLGVVFTSGCNTSKEVQKTNVILILADDLGWSQLGCYGSDFYKTPNIDKLAGNGMKFTSAYAAAAVCSPTRASLFTGKYPARLHITDFIAGNDRKYPLQQPDWQKFLPLEEITIAEVLKENGYNTAIFGKWHLSISKTPPESLDYNPDKQGFDESFITYKPSGNLPIGEWQTPENDAHNVDTITSRSIDFIKRNKENPFFLVVSHNSIHDPLMEREDVIGKYAGLDCSHKPENNPTIAAMIERLDDSMGRIIGILNALELSERTIVIFYSDNGGKESYAAQTPFRKGKGWLYEGGIRVPLIFKWEGEILPGIVTDQMVSSIDLFPTILELTASSMDAENTYDGESLYPLLIGEGNVDRDILYWNYPHYHMGTGMKPACAVRSGEYKLIEWYELKFLGGAKAYELYNIIDDPGEQNNLASEMPDKVEELRLLLGNWKKEVNAQEPMISQ
jgi:arylsulfatase A